MKSNSENNLKLSELPEPTGLSNQAEEFETKLREENLSLFRKFKLQNFMLETKNMDAE